MERQNYHKALFNLNPIAIYVWKEVEKELRLIDFNEAAVKITEGKVRSFKGISLNEMYSKNPDILNDFMTCLNLKKTITRKMSYKYKSTGKEKILEVSYNFISPDYVFVFTKDITKQNSSESSLRKSEREKALILSSIAEHVVYQDTNYNIIWTNKAAANSVNMNVNDLIGKKCYKLWCNPDGPIKDCPITITLKERVESEAEIRTNDGRVWFIKAYPVFDENNKLIGVVEVTNEITDLKNAQQTIETTEAKYANLISNIKDFVAEFDSSGKLIYANPSVFDILGYKPEELLGKTQFEIVHPNDRQAVIDAIDTQKSTGKIKDADFRLKHKKGHYTPVSASNSVFRSGDKASIITVIRDMTERKKFEEKLKISEKRYRSIFENSPVPMREEDLSNVKKYLDLLTNNGIIDLKLHFDNHPNIVKDLVDLSKVVDANKAEKKLLKAKTKEESLIGLNKIFVNKSYQTYAEEIIELYEGSSFFEAETLIKNLEGEILNIIFSINLLPGYEKDWSRVIVSHYNITQTIKAEKKYQKAYSRSEFLKDLFAHDISNILQSILLSAEFLSLESSKSNITVEKEMLGIVTQQLKRGIKLSSNVRLLSELDDMEINFCEIDIMNILRQCKEFIINSFPNREINITIVSDFNEKHILANELITDVFENLLFNSVHHNLNSEIEIDIQILKQVENDANFFRIELSDNGIGIPDTMKNKVFKRGIFEVESKTGSGLGLKLVKKLMDIYNGQIWIEDNIQNETIIGSKFILVFREIS